MNRLFTDLGSKIDPQMNLKSSMLLDRLWGLLGAPRGPLEPLRTIFNDFGVGLGNLFGVFEVLLACVLHYL